jgi:hypothetical protein
VNASGRKPFYGVGDACRKEGYCRSDGKNTCRRRKRPLTQTRLSPWTQIHYRSVLPKKAIHCSSSSACIILTNGIEHAPCDKLLAVLVQETSACAAIDYTSTQTKIDRLHSKAFARGGQNKMFGKQAAGPDRPGNTGKDQTAAPGPKRAQGGPPVRGVGGRSRGACSLRPWWHAGKPLAADHRKRAAQP